MKTLFTAVALSLASLAAFSQEATPAPEIDNFVSTRTRAEVQMDLRAAVARGALQRVGDASRAPELEIFASTRTRAAVHAEVLAAVAAGARLSQGEHSGDAFAPSVTSLAGASPAPMAAMAGMAGRGAARVQ